MASLRPFRGGLWCIRTPVDRLPSRAHVPHVPDHYPHQWQTLGTFLVALLLRVKAYDSSTGIGVVLILLTIGGPALMIIWEVNEVYESDALKPVKKVRVAASVTCQSHIKGEERVREGASGSLREPGGGSKPHGKLEALTCTLAPHRPYLGTDRVHVHTGAVEDGVHPSDPGPRLVRGGGGRGRRQRRGKGRARTGPLKGLAAGDCRLLVLPLTLLRARATVLKRF